VVNFNHMGLAFLTIFQSLTMESWTTLMYNYMDSNNVYIAIFFFIFLIIFGAFFTMQLVLAEIIESFQKEK
jgi:voltage-dependent calcium channel L type alpha-1D